LAKLRAYPTAVQALPLSSPVQPEIEMRDLVEVADRLRRDSGNGLRRLPEDVSIQRARDKWLDARKDLARLNSREIRVLCWDSETAMESSFVESLTRHPEFPRKRIWVEGIMCAYFGKWRQMAAPEKTEALLCDAIRHYTGVSDWMIRCRTHAEKMFSPRAAQFLAVQSRLHSKQVQETLDDWHLSYSGGLGPAVAAAAVEDWTLRFRREAPRLSAERALEQIKELTQRLLTFPTISNEVFGGAISEVLTCESVQAWEDVQTFLKSYILKHPRFGDPRVNAARWNSVSSEGRRRFISWLAQDDLLFFFDFVIPDRSDPHNRKSFWLQYIDFVEDSRVALSSTDRYRLRAQTTGPLAYANVTDSMDVSAFLMKFRGREEVVIVEFSRPNNAIYVHGSSQFARVLGSLRQREFRISSERGLKHSSCLEKFVHKQPNEKWHREVRNFLAGLGIRLR
jgi:hypothetical protein